MSQKQAKLNRRIMKKAAKAQKTKIADQFIAGLLTCSFKTRLKVAIKILRGAKKK